MVTKTGETAMDDIVPVDAHVRVFEADVELHPELSVGTERPESIYQATCRAHIEATSAADGVAKSTIRLPLPPQLISLSDVKLSVNDDPDDSVRWYGRYLLWEGSLDAHTPAEIDISYTAVGKGVFEIEPPFGENIIDSFETRLTAHQSDVRMLELSLQPQTYEKHPDRIVGHWSYGRLLVGQPIRLDVLGVAPPDRLAELVWLGPLSVLVFGALMAVLGLAVAPGKVDAWMLLLIIGAFAGGYPLMYFAQDFLPLAWAVLLSASLVLVIIAVRSLTLLGRVGAAVVAMAAGTHAFTISSAIYNDLQGVVLTVMGIVALALIMTLLPKAQAQLKAMNTPPAPPKPAERENSA
ncbi:MAG: hypothetical protein ACP5HU_08535 [Phycisphaerae bacterium]